MSTASDRAGRRFLRGRFLGLMIQADQLTLIAALLIVPRLAVVSHHHFAGYEMVNRGSKCSLSDKYIFSWALLKVRSMQPSLQVKAADCTFLIEALKPWLSGEVNFSSAIFTGMDGAPDRIRTCDQRLRKPLLYPAELRVRDWIPKCEGGDSTGLGRLRLG